MKNWLCRLLQYITYICPGKIRIVFLKIAGMNIGKNTQISPNCFFESPWLVRIGSGCLVNGYTKFLNSTKTLITIGNNVFISYEVTLLGTTHEINKEGGRCGKTLYQSINIQDGCWIGARVTILPGITIGKGCVIGAGAVVTKNCEPDTVYVGVPARAIRKL